MSDKTVTKEKPAMVVVGKTSTIRKALKMKVAEFKDAEEVESYSNENIKGKVVLAEWLPMNLIGQPHTFFECSSGLRASIKDKCTAEEIAGSMNFLNIIQANNIDPRKWFADNK